MIFSHSLFLAPFIGNFKILASYPNLEILFIHNIF